MAADLTIFAYFAPIMAFLVVFLVSFAVLDKTSLLGKSKWLNLFIAFVLAAVFISAGTATVYVQTITPWFGALLVSLFLLLILAGLTGKAELSGNVKNWFTAAALLIFLISALVVFWDTVGPYLPGTYDYVGTPLTDWLYSPPVVGALLLIGITAAVSYVLVKAK